MEARTRTRAISVAVAAVLLAGCLPDTVSLAYDFRPGATTSYELVARASAEWQIGGGAASSGSYAVTFDVTETVESVDASGALISVEMEPVDIEEQGLPSPGRGIRIFRIRVGSHGEVVRVLELDGVPAADLAPDDVAFIGTFRPPLPSQPVRLADRWQTRHELEPSSALQQLVTIGELVELGRDADGRKAFLEFGGKGPVVWTTDLPQGRATMTGRASTSGRAEVGIDDGDLRAASMHVEGRFSVRVVAEEGLESPIEGTLRLTLDVAATRG